MCTYKKNVDFRMFGKQKEFLTIALLKLKKYNFYYNTHSIYIDAHLQYKYSRSSSSWGMHIGLGWPRQTPLRRASYVPQCPASTNLLKRCAASWGQPETLQPAIVTFPSFTHSLSVNALPLPFQVVGGGAYHPLSIVFLPCIITNWKTEIVNTYPANYFWGLG